MIIRNYYGLKNGEYLGYNAGRKEKYYYCILQTVRSVWKLKEKTESDIFSVILHIAEKCINLGVALRAKN